MNRPTIGKEGGLICDDSCGVGRAQACLVVTAMLVLLGGLRVRAQSETRAVPPFALEAAPKPANATRSPLRSEIMDYGQILSATIVAPAPGANIAVKGIAIKLGDGAMVFDTDLLRWSAGWTGGFLNLEGTAFDGKQGPNPSVKGELAFATAQEPGWSADARGRFDMVHELPFGPLPAWWAKYRGLYLCGDQTVVSYTVASATVLELPACVRLPGGSVVFTRTFQISGQTEKRSVVISDPAPTVLTESTRRNGLAVVGMAARATTKTVAGLIGAPAGAALDALPGGRILLRLPEIPETATFTVAIWTGATAGEVEFAQWLAAAPRPPDVQSLTRGGPGRWTEPVVTRGQLGVGDGAYIVDTLTAPDDNPYRSWQRFGGFDFFSDGHRAAITTWSGDVWIVSGIDESLQHLVWRRFAAGLHQPLGLRIVDDEIYVLGRDQITRLHDLNHDGEADFYENFNNDVIVSPAFHEFALDLQSDSHGNFYFGKAGAVRNGGRGWQSITKHNGTILRVSADGSKLDVFATGLRAPNGLGMSPRDELTVADNQGTWVPACRLDFVREGDFLGVVDLAHRATPPENYGNPVLWFPHGDGDNSGGAQVWVPDDRWGPFKGELLQTSYGKSALFLVMHETVGGVHQGGVVRFPLEFATGIMRARFNPQDGQLYVCGLKGWQTTAARDGALQRVRYTGKPVEMPMALHVKPGGIEIGFTAPIRKESAEDVQNYAVEQWNYRWTSAYGSPEFSILHPDAEGRDPVAVQAAHLSADGRTVFLELADVQPVMQMKIRFRLNSANGPLLDYEIFGTIGKVP